MSYLMAQDTLNGAEGKITITRNGRILEAAGMRNIKTIAGIQTSDMKTIGTRKVQKKANGVTQTGTGSPTVGNGYILNTVAAAVIGGVSQFGGRGGLASTIVGAFILTIIGNLVFVLSISSYWQPIASGVILLAAVLASSLAEKSARRGGM